MTAAYSKPLQRALPTLLVAVAIAYINYLFGYYTQYYLAIARDSTSYLETGPMRQLGYPAMAALVTGLSGDLRWLGLLQLNLLLLSFAALGHGFGRLAGNRLLGAVLTLLLCGILPLLKVSQYFLTETVFATLICFHLAALCHYLNRASLPSAFALGATVALIYLARPAGLPFAATLLLLLLHRRRRDFAWALLPVFAGLLLIASVNKIRHDAFTIATPSGIVLISYVGNLLESGDGEGTRHEQAMARLAQRWPSLTRAQWPGGYWWGAGKTGDVGYMFLKKMNPGGSVYPATFARLKSDNSVSLQWARLIISKRPLEYVKLVTANYYALWRHGFLRGSAALPHQDMLQGAGDFPASAADYYFYSSRLLDSRPRLRESYERHGMDTAYLFDAEVMTRREALAGDSTLLGRWWGLLSGGRVVIIAAVLLLCPLSFALLLTRHRRDPLIQLCACAAFLLHAYTLFIALIHPGFVRYAVPLNPLLLLFVLAMAVALIRLAAGMKDRASCCR